MAEVPVGFRVVQPEVPDGFRVVEDVPRETTPTPSNLTPEAAEGLAAINRGITAIPDSIILALNTVIDFANQNPALREAGGAVFMGGDRIPNIPTTLELGQQVDPRFGARNFMEPGLARDVIQAGGELVAPALTMGTASAPAISQRATQLADDAAAEAARVGGRIRVGDKRAATQAVNQAGEVVRDPAAAAAIRQGFDDGVVSTIKAATNATKARMRKMVEIAKRGINERAFANKNRPADVVGNAVSKRVTRIAEVNKRAGQRIDKEAKKLAGKPVNTQNAKQLFDDDLAEAGVRFGDDGVDLVGSDFEDVANVEQLFNVVDRRLGNIKDAQQAHRFKRWIDNQISNAKFKEGGLTGDAERLLLGVRRAVDDAIDAQYPAYKAANDTFRETKQVLDAFQDAAGKINLDSPNVAKQIGTLSRRLLSNVQSRVRLLDSLEGLDEVAANHGLDISDDIFALARFADELDNVFKPVARTSFNAEVAKGTRAAIDRGPARAFIDEGIERGVERLTGINEEGALKAIEELLKP